MSRSKCLVLFATITFLSLSGGFPASAGGDTLNSAQGKITLNGQPLPKGKITFHLADGQFIGARVNDDGSYKIDRIPVGMHKVTVEAIINGKNLLPARYASEEQSQLRVEVKKGKNTFDISLATR
jgi:hypothetical protein